MKYLKLFEEYVYQYPELFANLLRKNELVELVPVSFLKTIGEFDRRSTPKYSLEDSLETIEQLKDVLLSGAMTDPLKIDYYQSEKKVLLIEGNHRLSAALEMGMEYLPAEVYRTTRSCKNRKAKKVSGYVRPASKYEDTYVPANLRPSQVGIPVFSHT